MRAFHRYGKRHLFKIILGSSMMLAFVTLFMVSNSGSIEIFYDIPFMKVDSANPLIIVITPTYRRPTRLADLTRMANTLQQVPDLYWIVVEDATEKVKLVERILIRTRLPYTYFPVKTIPGYPKRGWYQRTEALTFLRNETQLILNGRNKGVVYFGDDDNSYDIRLFTEYIRNVKKLGLWAVGMVGGAPVESLNVVNGSVVGFKVKWNPKRKFAVDMAGFAVHLDIVLNSKLIYIYIYI
uniref:Galactosylgalactosylxylosylprotein 3-beta-glucuronosyltransferase n=1 Tax=Heterorhabditis bacteriophora TaxID=37862 RepID=A0A1I7XKV8_HETBA